MRALIYISLITFIILSCKKKEFVIDNLNGGEIEILGHGGSGIADLYPIDTKESVFNCLNLGADGSEMDVQLTKDNVLVLFHGEDLSANTNMSGKIRDHTFEELKDVEYTSTPYAAQGIPSLEEILTEVPLEKGYKFSFDIKLLTGSNEATIDYRDDFAEAIKGLFQQYELYNIAYVEIQTPSFIELLQQVDPAIRIFFFPQDFDYGFQVAQNLGLYGLSMSTKAISGSQVKEAHDAGMRVIIWNVKSKSEHDEAILKNPDIVESDNLTYLIDLLQ